MDSLEQIKAKGFPVVEPYDSFDDGEFAQIAFKDSMGVSYIAYFRNGQLLTIA